MRVLVVRDGGSGLLSPEGDLSQSVAQLVGALQDFADVEVVVTGEEALERAQEGGVDVVAFVSKPQIHNAEQLTERWRDLRVVVMTNHMPATAELMSDGRVTLAHKQLLARQDALREIFLSVC